MRISDWSSDVCSSDLLVDRLHPLTGEQQIPACAGALENAQGLQVERIGGVGRHDRADAGSAHDIDVARRGRDLQSVVAIGGRAAVRLHDTLDRHHARGKGLIRSEEHTSELQSIMRISYAVFCLKKKNIQK